MDEIRTAMPQAHRRRIGAAPVPAVLAVLGLLVAGAFAAPVDHDESQYVAAVAAMRHGLPYRDFAYLQTPLQPLLFAPFAMLPPGWLVMGLRLANALCALATLLLVHATLRRHGVGRRPAAAAALMLLTANAFLFAASVARNDALPMLLFTGGLAAALRLVRSPRDGTGPVLVAGLLLGGAISAKISYALPAAAIGAALLAMRALPGGRLLRFTLGGIAGLSPMLALAALAPEAAWFGIVDYSLVAPQQWRHLIGRIDMLSPPAKLLRLAGFAALGVPLVALGAVVADRVRGRAGRDRRLLLLDAAIVGAALAAYLPDPTYRQYLVPLLPPLLLRFGMLVAARPFAPAGWRGAVLAAFMLAGLAPTLIALASAVRRGSPLLAVVDDARAIRRMVGDAPVVTLAPERVAGAGATMDPRFVAGPFLFRILPPAASRIPAHWQALGMADAAAALDAAPPRALLTGSEPRPFAGHPRGLDGLLEDWARRRGYARRTLPSGTMRLWVRDVPATPPSATR